MAEPVAELQPTAELPEGFVLDAPAGVEQPVAQGVNQPQEGPGFTERVSADFEQRGRELEEIKRATDSGEQTLAEGVFQVIGKVGAGSVLDVLGEGAVSAIEGLSAITPDIIEDPLIETATKLTHDFLNTDIGKAGLKAAQKGFAEWSNFAKENPRAARNIESVVDIGLLAAPVKGRAKIKSKPTLAGIAGEKMASRGAAQTARQKADFIDDLVLPKSTAAVRTEQVARTTEEGALKTKTTGLSDVEKRMADEVSKIPDVGSEKTIQGNYTVISQEVLKEAKALKAELRTNDVPIPRREFSAELDRVTARLEQNPILVGDASKSAVKVVEQMKRLVDKNPGTASGLLQARKELDAWIKTQKPKVFDPKTDSSLSIAVREIRQSTNDFIDARATNVAVKDSLRKQSTLLSAMENIAPKAADEAGNSMLRAWQNANKVLGLRGVFNQTMAAAFGLGGLGASAVFAPMFTKLAIGGVVTFAAGKVIMSSTVKKGLSKLLNATDKAIRKTKDKALLSQLRLDRGAIFELMKQAREDEK